MKKAFTLVELLIVITIIGILASIGLNSFTGSQKKSRDAQRKAHLKQLADTFEAYYNDHGQYPTDDDNGSLDGFTWNTAFQDEKGTVYMVKLPQDPTLGYTYFYDAIPNAASSNTKYQLYARLENDLDLSIINISSPECGSGKLCNYGVSSTNTTPTEGR